MHRFALILLAVSGLLACSKDEPSVTVTPIATTAAPPASTPAPAPAPAPSPSPTQTQAPAPTPTPKSTPTSKATPTPTANGTPAANGTGTATPAAFPACGDKPLPPCPLYSWMKANTGPAMASGDLPKVAAALDKVVTFAPAEYTNWASIARDGANAARQNNLEAVKASCRSCHNQYKARYKAEMRGRPL